MKKETVHLAFRSAETGRYLFHIQYPKDKFEIIELASKEMNISVEEFIVSAIKNYIDKLYGVVV